MEAVLMNKKQLGQFFTKNSDYILAGLEKYIKNKEVVDPFAGGGDLIEWAIGNNAKSIRGFDVDQNLVDKKNVFYNDSIRNPKKYNFVLTNPPYLNVNKAGRPIKDKYFANSDFEDLYQLSLASIMNSREGIVIVPINFLSAENSEKIRKLFFSKFKIIEMNYFREQVFPDTTYNVIAFYYRTKENMMDGRFTIRTNIYPGCQKTQIELKKDFGWSIGGEKLNKIKNLDNLLGIHRLIESDVEVGPKNIIAAHNHIKDTSPTLVSENFYKLVKSNIIFLKAIDSGTELGRIALEDINSHNVDCLISKESSRHMIQLIFGKPIPIQDQRRLISLFNNEIKKLREEYLSLFLTNYRDNDRKRISFDFVYKFLNYLYNDFIDKKSQSKNLQGILI